MTELPKEWSSMWLDSQREIAQLRLRLTERECDLAEAISAIDLLLKLRAETPMTEADAYHTLFKSSGAFEWSAAEQIVRAYKKCAHCGQGMQFDGTWHTPDCPTLNHPVQKLSPPITGDGDGEGNAPKDSR